MKTIKGTRQLNMEKEFKKDCPNYKYIPDTLESTSRTVAIGDIHGDIEVAVNMLKVGKCIKQVKNKTKNSITLKNKYYEWIGGDTIVVQVGDQVDRCRPIGDQSCVKPKTTTDDEASDIDILKFYTELDEYARKKGGRVISLLGNHELMNVSGKMQYVSFMGLMEFVNSVDLSDISSIDKKDLNTYVEEGLKNRRNAFTNKSQFKRNEALNEYLACTRPSAIIVGDLLFVHGGMIKKMAELYDLDDLNMIVRKWLLGKITEECIDCDKDLLRTRLERNNSKGVSFNFKERLKLLLHSSHKGISIFWNRILGQLPSDMIVKDMSEDSKTNINKRCDELLKPVLDVFKINGIVVGHTPQMDAPVKGINSTCNERVWRTDIGASKAFNVFRDSNEVQRIEVLEIVRDENNNNKYTVLY